MSGFFDDGFIVVREFWTEDEIDAVETAIMRLYMQQFSKCAESLGGKWPPNWVKCLERMEATKKAELYEVQKMIASSQAVRGLYNSEFMDACADKLECRADDLLLHGPGLLINRPNTTRLLYKWHSEAHYYPKRRQFLNIWLPLFGPKHKLNGTMSFKVGSHKQDFPFYEWREGPNSFNQLEIPDYFLTDYDEHFVEADRGDVVVFDRSLVNTSNSNMTSDYSFALVARVWNPEHDLTFSGDMEATPYGGDSWGQGISVRVDADAGRRHLRNVRQAGGVVHQSDGRSGLLSIEDGGWEETGGGDIAG